MSLGLVTVPLTFQAMGNPTVGAPFEPVTRTVNVLQPDEVLIKVSYASINAMDLKVQNYNWCQLPLPMVLGYDCTGVVVLLGTSIGLYAGEEEAITLGSSVIASTFGMGWGGGCFGEYVVAKRDRVQLRGDIPEEVAATYGIAYLSAYEPLFMAMDIRTRPGQTIFIPGGAGGVGHFAVQLAKAYGLRVIASASKPAGVELLEKLRADVVIDYSKQDVVVAVLEATEGRGADVVYDSTYLESSMKQSAAVVAKGGQWVRLGTFMGPPTLQPLLETIVTSRGGKLVIGDLARYSTDPAFQSNVHSLSEGVRMARQLYAEGQVKPYISATVPLEASALQQAVQDSGKGVLGKVVVKVQ